MQTINQLTSRILSETASGQLSARTPENANSGKTWRVNGEKLTLTDLLWTRLSDAYGAAFARQYGEKPNEVWNMAMADITPDMVKRGLAKMVADAKFKTFPPNALEFRELCLPASEDLGLPSEADAYRMALNWSALPPKQRHPAVLAALREMDSWAFRRMPEVEARKTFKADWDKVVGRVRAEGHGWLPEITIGELPSHSSQPKDAKAMGRAVLANILAELPPKTRSRVSVEI